MFSFASGQGPLLEPQYFFRSSAGFPMTITSSLGSYYYDCNPPTVGGPPPPVCASATIFDFYNLGSPSLFGFANLAGSPFFAFGDVSSSSCFMTPSCQWDDLNNSSTQESVVQTYMPFPLNYGLQLSQWANAPWIMTAVYNSGSAADNGDIIFPYYEGGTESAPAWSHPMNPYPGIAGSIAPIDDFCDEGTYYTGIEPTYISPTPGSFALDDIQGGGACQSGDTTNCVLYITDLSTAYNAGSSGVYCTPSSNAPQGPCIYYWNNVVTNWNDTTTLIGGPTAPKGCLHQTCWWNCCGFESYTDCNVPSTYPSAAWTNVPGGAKGTGYCIAPYGQTDPTTCAGAAQITYDVWPTTHVLYALDANPSSLGAVWYTLDNTDSRPIASGTWTKMNMAKCDPTCMTCSGTLIAGQIAAYNGVAFALETDSSSETASSNANYGKAYESCSNGNGWKAMGDKAWDSISANPSAASNLTGSTCTEPECAVLATGVNGNVWQWNCQ